MSFCQVRSFRTFAAASLMLAAAAFVIPTVSLAQTATEEAKPAAESAGPTVPPVPEGTPEELLNYIKGLRRPTPQPKSRQEMMEYMKQACIASVEAADKILAQLKPEDAAYVEAAKLKLDSLATRGRMGEGAAIKAMADYAASLATCPNAELAKEGKRMVLVSEAQSVFSSGNAEAAAGLLQKLVDMVSADPDDAQTAGMAGQMLGGFERIPNGEALTVKAYESLVPLFAKSGQPQVREMGEHLSGVLRRLSLLGKPMDLKGTMLDGSAFDQKSLAGKVVLVDFWATWCGPCRAEIPNMKAEYEKYHDKGFEVVGVSLDDNRDALAKFVESEQIPWPILVDKGEGGQNVAGHYGISAIPQLILIGRDGNVITLNARGPKLAEELAKLFKDAG